MSAPPAGEAESLSPHSYFVDETGDGVIFDSKGRVLVGTVRRLFDKKLHTRPAFEVIFASRGNARTLALREHLLEAQEKSRKAAGTFADATIHVRAMPAHLHAGLQVADYCLWALQRLFMKEEDRFLSLIWPKVGLIVDADDTSENPYGTYHTRKRPPMNVLGIKNRKVED
ncbi:MAG: DUF3800 domain-containing protein [Akkermansiaceae bacterium]